MGGRRAGFPGSELCPRGEAEPRSHLSGRAPASCGTELLHSLGCWHAVSTEKGIKSSMRRLRKDSSTRQYAAVSALGRVGVVGGDEKADETGLSHLGNLGAAGRVCTGFKIDQKNKQRKVFSENVAKVPTQDQTMTSLNTSDPLPPCNLAAKVYLHARTGLGAGHTSVCFLAPNKRH